jgi:Kef-type K+ transport system membrane component KefB
VVAVASFLVVVAAASALAPLLAALVGRVVGIPLVVFELALGILVGPAVLGWVQPTGVFDTLSNIGVAMLFFLAGSEIDFAAIRGRPLRRSILGWLVSLVAGVGAGLMLAPDPVAGVFIGIALTSTALGALLPMLRDAGELRTGFGAAVVALGAVGEFGPLVAISLFLSGREPLRSAVVLAVFVVLAAGAILLAARGTHLGLHRIITATLHTSGQFAVRLVLVIVALLVALSVVLGLDMLLGAFAAGVIFRLLLADGDPTAVHTVESKVDAVGFGFLVPLFFLHTGVTFDLPALLADPTFLLAVPVFLVLLLVVRGLPAMLSSPRGAPAADRCALALFGATGLPIIITVTAIGTEDGVLSAGLATALVTAGLLSVLLFPLLGFWQHRRAAPRAAGPGAPPVRAGDEAIDEP